MQIKQQKILLDDFHVTDHTLEYTYVNVIFIVEMHLATKASK